MGQTLVIPPISRPNQVVINGGFTIAQQGSTLNFLVGDSSTVTLDRWSWGHEAVGGINASGSVSQIPFPLGQTEVPGNPRYYCRITNTSVGSALGAGSYSALTQGIEDVRMLAGMTLTLSFYARSSIPNKRLGAEFSQFFGWGGSTHFNAASKGFILTNTFKRYIFTATMPSVFGKTLAAGNNLTLLLWLASGTTLASRCGFAGGFEWGGTGTTDLANIQIDVGNQAAPCQPHNVAQDLRQCLRYLWVANGELLGITRDGMNLFGGGKLTFPVPMREVPTLFDAKFSPDMGVPILTSPTPYSTGFQNQSGNFPVGIGIGLSGRFDAGL